MNIDVDKIVVSLDVVAPDAVVVEASAVAPSGIVTEAVAELPTQVVVISHEEPPTVSPLEIIDFGSSSIECAFDVTTEQAEEVVKGVLCGTTNPPTFENADYRLLHGQGIMDLAFAGLHQDTEYYLRPYALSNLGYKYGDVVAQRTKANPIPEEYQLVEYLENTDKQWINTLYYADESTVVSVLFSRTRINVNDDILIGSTWQTSGVAGRHFFLSIRPTNFCADWNGQRQVINYIIVNDRIYEIEFGNKELKIDNTTIAVYSNSSFQELYPIALFTTSIRQIQFFIGRIYKVIVSDNNGYQRRMYPVYRKADNKPGMYDIVNNTFYINQGTGEFIVGPDKEWEE